MSRRRRGLWLAAPWRLLVRCPDARVEIVWPRDAAAPGVAGEGNAERGAAARSALDVDRAAQTIHELLHDVEAEPDAAALARRGGVDLAEHVEDERHLVGRDADPGVGHLEEQPVHAGIHPHC